MHELFICESIIGSVRRSLPPDIDSVMVEEVSVLVGKLDAVVTENLIFLFDAIKAGRAMPFARLSVVEEDVRCLCRECGESFRIESPLFLCPVCGSGDVTVVEGRGVRLTNITVREPSDIAADPVRSAANY